MAIFASPPLQERELSGGESPDDYYDDLFRVKLFFYTSNKSLKEKLFPEEWYTVMAAEYGEDQISTDL